MRYRPKQNVYVVLWDDSPWISKAVVCKVYGAEAIVELDSGIKTIIDNKLIFTDKKDALHYVQEICLTNIVRARVNITLYEKALTTAKEYCD